MTISTRLDSYLSMLNITYQVVEHKHSASSFGSAIMAKIPLNQIAKAVILKDHEDRKLMAVLPATNKISISAINDNLMGSYKLLKEREVYQIFKDCDHGAIPPVGEAFNMQMVCDEMLDKLNYVYIEAGDHRRLLRLTHDDYQTLCANSKHLRFSSDLIH
ncbi:MAG: YbaK/EbsC family protein [Litorilituus sp.]|nr:YbaK/EbsC family protein [Litorilituus sp.]